MVPAIVHLSKSKKNMGRIKLVKGSHKMGWVKDSDRHSYVKDIYGSRDLESAYSVDADTGDVLFLIVIH